MLSCPLNNSTLITMKHLILIAALFLTGCMTVPDQYGQPRKILSPAGQGLVNTVLYTAVGAGTGALMQNQPSWQVGLAAGAASGAAGMVSEALMYPEYYGANYPVASTPQTSSNTLYRRTSDGQFVAVQN
jgi:hypothetical protein